MKSFVVVALCLKADVDLFSVSPGGTEPKKLSHIKPKPRPTANQPQEQNRLQLANCEEASTAHWFPFTHWFILWFIHWFILWCDH